MGEAKGPERPIYLDFAATTPVDPRVAELVMHYMVEEFGNAGSRTHEYGARAAKAVEKARRQVAALVACDPSDVVFTSGATEADNLAILGLAAWGEEHGRTHIVSTAIEHKAVLAPLEELERRGFKVDLVMPQRSGQVLAEDVLAHVRDDTLMVSVMHVNNETGVIQPIEEVAAGLPDSVYFHTDAAQSYGKGVPGLTNARIDLISASGHKIYAPKGVGALITRRRNRRRPPLKPLMFGGGQERGLRPGTVPVQLVAGFGLAAELAAAEWQQRKIAVTACRENLLASIQPLGGYVNGELSLAAPDILSVTFPQADSEAVLVQARGTVAASNGSACNSSSYSPSHVLASMGVTTAEIQGSLRFSFAASTDLTVTGSATLLAVIRSLF